MAHFAEIGDSGLVLRVIRIPNQAPNSTSLPESEPAGQAFIASTLKLPGTWKQTSYHGHYRRRFAGIGMTYDEERDAFLTPQPYPSWTLDDNHDWQPPIPRPEEGEWTWDEVGQEWVEAEEGEA